MWVRGTVTTTFTNRPNKKQQNSLRQTVVNYFYKGHTSTLQFQTAYERATGRFQYHYIDNQPFTLKRTCYTIASDGKQTKSWWTINPGDHSTKEESLSSALGAATGISKTSSRKIPGLLLSKPIEAGWDIKQVRDWQRISDAKQAGRDCYRFIGTGYKIIKATLYIDNKTWLIVRIDEAYPISEADVNVVMEYKPQLNRPIPASALAMQDVCK
jgi:hypothetical protein